AAIADAAAGEGLLDLRAARSEAEAEDLWAARKALSPALRSLAPKKVNEDVAVPVSRLPELIRGVAALSRTHGLRIVCFGHAGNGN
ncbi:FAD-linked oxidase C-terminal domain-containing protein, partial [Acinetobacter baumannii]